MMAPKWDALKEFYDRYKTLEGDSLVAKNATSVSGASITPLITDLRSLMGVEFVPTSSGTGYKTNACGKIAVAIANPYCQPLKWNQDLEFKIRNLTPSGNSPSRIYNLWAQQGGQTAFINAGPPGTTEAAVFNQAIFRIRPATLAPGEARAYTNSGYISRPVANGMQRLVVDLAPFGSSLPTDFSKCVELDDANKVYTSFPGLDVRESWQTSLVGLEMRLAGGRTSDQPLRRIDGFELDNGYFGANTRYHTLDYCRSRPNPIGLMCYSFQLMWCRFVQSQQNL